MAAVLSDADVRRFHDEGFLSPIKIVEPEEANACRSNLEEFEAETGKPAVELNPHQGTPLLRLGLEAGASPATHRSNLGHCRTRPVYYGFAILD